MPSKFTSGMGEFVGVSVRVGEGVYVSVGVSVGVGVGVAGWQAEKRNTIEAYKAIFFICPPRNIIY